MRDDFNSWLRHEKYTALLTIVCTLLPLLQNIDFSVKERCPFCAFLLERSYDLANIFFLLVTLVMLVNTDFLINRDEKKSEFLYQYVRRTFGVNCELYIHGPSSLFHRMNVSVKQFYYSWICVWCIWLILYVNRFVFCAFRFFCTEESGNMLSRLTHFSENILNLMNSFVLLFIYMVITISTTGAGLSSNSHKPMHIGVICLIFIAAVVLFVDLFSFSVDGSIYDDIQFWLRLFIGFIATISLIAVVGRLNSSYLNVPQWLMVGLYIYAATQMLYPMSYEELYNDPVTGGDVMIHQGTVIKQSVIINQGIINQGGTCRNFIQHIDINTNAVSKLLYVLSFGGKVCLFLMIRWIAQQKRFLFFLLQKANSMCESTAMLREFYKIYEGCPDKEK